MLVEVKKLKYNDWRSFAAPPVLLSSRFDSTNILNFGFVWAGLTQFLG
jgi:hypothetical protein